MTESEDNIKEDVTAEEVNEVESVDSDVSKLGRLRGLRPIGDSLLDDGFRPRLMQTSRTRRMRSRSGGPIGHR